MRFHGFSPSGGVESENWSGYAVTGSDFTSARGSWVEPTVNCTKTPNAYAAFWVGIDGYSSSTVEQTGTLAYCDGATATYYAWYEFYPNPLEIISTITVTPGNKFVAEVIYNGSVFTTRVTDESTGESYAKQEKVSGALRSSAEWIAEAPASSGGILPLADFGTASFGEKYSDVGETNDATDSTLTGPIGAFGNSVEAITMVSSSSALEAVPSALIYHGTSFTVAWKSE